MAAGKGGAESACDALVHDPDATTRSLALRDLADLPYDPAALGADLPLMLDTSACIDQLKGRLPGRVLRFVAGRSLLHAGTALLRLLETIRLRDCVAPSAAAWMEAGMLVGILARTQLGLARAKAALSAEQACCRRGERRRLLKDALIFLTAQEQGAVLHRQPAGHGPDAALRAGRAGAALPARRCQKVPRAQAVGSSPFPYRSGTAASLSPSATGAPGSAASSAWSNSVTHAGDGSKREGYSTPATFSGARNNSSTQSPYAA